MGNYSKLHKNHKQGTSSQTAKRTIERMQARHIKPIRVFKRD